MKPQQHDAHCTAFDQHLWDNWPPATNEQAQVMNEALAEGGVTLPVTVERYVIAKSDSIENLYWDDFGSWRPLREACMYERPHITKNPEPVDGFWMPLERAQELER